MLFAGVTLVVGAVLGALALVAVALALMYLVALA